MFREIENPVETSEFLRKEVFRGPFRDVMCEADLVTGNLLESYLIPVTCQIGAVLRIPGHADRHSEVMSIMIPKWCR